MKSKSRIVSVLTGLLIFTLMPLNGANGADYTPAITGEIAGAQTLLVYPSDVTVAPNGDVWWSDWDSDKIFLFDKDATGDTAPKKIISMARPDNAEFDYDGDVSAIAVDAAGFLYASDAWEHDSAFVRVFNPNLKNSQTIDDAVRTITLERRARGIAVDADGYIYIAHEVSNSDSHLKVSIYAPGITNSASAVPVRSFTDNGVTVGDNVYGIAVNSAGEVIFGNPASDSIRIYAKNSTGTPLRTISGDQTQLSTLCDYWRVRIDSIGRIYVGDAYDAGSKILVFESSANGNVAPSSVVVRTLSGDVLPYALSGNSIIWYADASDALRRIANPLTFPSPPAPAAVSEAQAKAAAAAAAAKREAEVKTARADISKTLEKADKLTADAFAKADIAGVTSENITQVQAEILALPAELRTDINQVLKVARKYEVVGKIASEQATTLPITAFVEVGLIPADSKNKVALIAAIRRAAADTRDSFADIQAVIAAEAARIQDRKDRLAATLARLKSK